MRKKNARRKKKTTERSDHNLSHPRENAINVSYIFSVVSSTQAANAFDLFVCFTVAVLFHHPLAVCLCVYFFLPLLFPFDFSFVHVFLFPHFFCFISCALYAFHVVFFSILLSWNFLLMRIFVGHCAWVDEEILFVTVRWPYVCGTIFHVTVSMLAFSCFDLCSSFFNALIRLSANIYLFNHYTQSFTQKEKTKQ